MSSNKENVMPKIKTSNIKENKPLFCLFKKDEKLSNLENHRDPLKTVANQNVDQNSLAGPSWSFGFSYNMRNVPSKNVQSHSVEKKVKKSLKRPHSVVIQRISPFFAATTHFSSQSWLEAKSQSRKVVLEVQAFQGDQLDSFYALDNIKYLLKMETKLVVVPIIRMESRACVINWLLKVYNSNGNPAVVQQACWNLDRYLSRTWVTAARLQVIAAACFWISTKYFLGTYMSAGKLVKTSGCAFIEKELVAAEKNVLRKLDFQVHNAVPYDFVPFLSWWCGLENSLDVEVAATFICQCGIIVDKSLNIEYPSVIAAAAVRLSLVFLYKTNCMKKLEFCPVYKAAKNKSSNISQTCDQLYRAIQIVKSSGFEYKALLCQSSGPPSFIVNQIFRDL